MQSSGQSVVMCSPISDGHMHIMLQALVVKASTRFVESKRMCITPINILVFRCTAPPIDHFCTHVDDSLRPVLS